MKNQTNTVSPYEVIASFKAAIAEMDIVTDDPIIADGQLHRFRIQGHKSGTLNGAYALHLDGNPAGYLGLHDRNKDQLETGGQRTTTA